MKEVAAPKNEAEIEGPKRRKHGVRSDGSKAAPAKPKQKANKKK